MAEEGIDCTINHLPLEEVKKKLFTKDADGNVAVRVKNVIGCAEDGLSCEEAQLTFDELFLKAIGVSTCGKLCLRLAYPE